MRNKKDIKYMKESIEILERHMLETSTALSLLENRVASIENLLESKCAYKHAKDDKDEVLEIFNDLINDIDNAHITIIKKDN